MVFARIIETVAVMLLLLVSWFFSIRYLLMGDIEKGVMYIILTLIANALTTIAFDFRSCTMDRQRRQRRRRYNMRPEEDQNEDDN